MRSRNKSVLSFLGGAIAAALTLAMIPSAVARDPDNSWSFNTFTITIYCGQGASCNGTYRIRCPVGSLMLDCATCTVLIDCDSAAP
jgi:hypothetical protein